MPYGITQCYLPPDRGENPAFITMPKQLLDLATPEGCKAELTYVTMKADRPGIEPATCKSHVQRPTADPPRKEHPAYKCLVHFSPEFSCSGLRAHDLFSVCQPQVQRPTAAPPRKTMGPVLKTRVVVDNRSRRTCRRPLENTCGVRLRTRRRALRRSCSIT